MRHRWGREHQAVIPRIKSQTKGQLSCGRENHGLSTSFKSSPHLHFASVEGEVKRGLTHSSLVTQATEGRARICIEGILAYHS